MEKRTHEREAKSSQGLESLRRSTQKVIDTIKQLKQFLQKTERPETQEISEQTEANDTKGKIYDAIRSFARVVNGLLLVKFIFWGVEQYQINHLELESSRDENGDITYKHPDPETTHILNVLGGRETFSEQEALNYFRENIKKKAEFLHISLPEDFETYTLDQIAQFFVPTVNAKGFKVTMEEFKNFFYHSQYLSRVEAPKGAEKEVYTLVWQAEQECGNPYVRFQTENITDLDRLENFTRPYFSSKENTIYIPLETFLGGYHGKNGYQNILAELSHAKQLHDDPFKYITDALESQIRIIMDNENHYPEIDERRLKPLAYEREYEIPGSLENVAHHVIEPDLRRRYKLLNQVKGVDGTGTLHTNNQEDAPKEDTK